NLAQHVPSWSRWALLLLLPTLGWLVQPAQVGRAFRWLIVRIPGPWANVDKRRAARRGRFASTMAARVAQVSAQEEWRDERFAEMDAEVEVHGRQRRGRLRRRRREIIRRVPSLSVALEKKSSDPIILLEGEPGSGKSVALRHLAVRLATRVRE